MLRFSALFLICTLFITFLVPELASSSGLKRRDLQNGGKRCPPNQIWESCGTACPLNCQNFRNPPEVCTLQCVLGCFCAAPYVFLSGKSGPCVLPKKCPPPHKGY
ncbi:hypothetical protein GDO86_020320 [Hymenochirus boettgeri]|uniref:TIL domain-containing protein n=1 Tax=Hymenochirus boettgeri TaxID=247094 RepID=A0A8T2IFK0_9PIPI|nr:hypothetical protein GDO86_020320 [Hymenochirus boettgeri]